MLKRCLPLVALAVLVASPVMAGVEDEVRGLVLAGEIMPFETIRNRIVAQVRADYIGAEFDAGSRIYRFRFLSNGSVINVDVDARTGQRVRKTNNY